MIAGIAATLRAFDDGRDRSEFYRGWRAGLSAGLTHPHVLAMMRAPATARGTTAAMRRHLLDGTTKGEGIAALVRQRPALFEPFEAALLILGDETGRLEEVLGGLADFAMRQYRMMLVVKRRLAYPMFLTLVATLLLPLPLVFRGQTRAYFVSVALGLAGWALFGGALIAGRAQAYQRKPPFVRARLARALATAIEAGLPLGRAAALAAGASGSPFLVAQVRRYDERALASQPLSHTFASAPGSPLTPEFQAALAVAERTGDHSTTLRKLAELYEDGFR